MSLYVAKKLIFNKKHLLYLFFAKSEVFSKIYSTSRGGERSFLNSENVRLREGGVA